MNMTDMTRGGCFCGAIRFSIASPELYACFCHCESCQRAAGAPVVAWATFRRDSVEVSEGEIRWHESSPGVTRGHCANCGTCISYENAKRSGEIDITLNTLHDPSAIEPRSHIWVEDKQPWLVIGDDLPQYRQFVS